MQPLMINKKDLLLQRSLPSFAKIYFLITLSIIMCSGKVLAQKTSTLINSDPPGVILSLEGEYRITATTPCRLPENITGFYRLKARLTGYETWDGEIMILPGQDNTFSFTLSPKTRFKAGLRSLFFPGWGQYYSDQRYRAALLSLSTLGLGVASLIADADYRRKRDDYFQIMTDLSNAVTAEEILQLRNLAREKNRQAYDAETTRNVFIGVTVGLWAYNLIDAIIFFPERKFVFQKPLTIGLNQIKADFDGQETNLKLIVMF